MASLKDTTVNGSLTAASIKRSDNSSNILKGDGGTLTYGDGSKFNISKGHDHPYLSNTTNYAGSASKGGAANDSKKLGNINASDYALKTYVQSYLPWNKDSITLDSIVLDGTTLKNVEFQNVGNGIFLSKYILKRTSMDRLRSGGSDVGNGDIGKAAASSIEAALKRQFGNSIRLKTYCRTYDGAAHAEKVFLPLESEVHGSGNMQYSADKKDIYPRWQVPNRNVKTEINNISNTWYWWCANKSSYSGDFCIVVRNGAPGSYGSSDYDYNGVALAFYL